MVTVFNFSFLKSADSFFVVAKVEKNSIFLFKNPPTLFFQGKKEKQEFKNSRLNKII